MYRPGRFPDYNVACGRNNPLFIMQCTIPYAKSFTWSAKPLIGDKYTVGQNKKKLRLQRGRLSIEYKSVGVSTIKFRIERFAFTNNIYIHLECMSNDTAIDTTNYSINIKICKCSIKKHLIWVKNSVTIVIIRL